MSEFGGNFGLILPEIVLVLAGFALLMLDVFLPKEDRPMAVGLVAVVCAGLGLWSLFRTPQGLGLGGMISSDGFSIFFRAVLMGILLMVCLSATEYVQKKNIPPGEFYALLFFATAGAMLMVVSVDLISFYVGLELLSIPSYVLAGMLRDDPRSKEASLKYFLNGTMASGILLFGMSLFFGITGSTSLSAIATALEVAEINALSLAALVFMVGGLAFKLAAVPFHLWAPDTYEGAPTPVAAFLAAASEGAAVAAVLRIFFTGLAPLKGEWAALLGMVAVLTMTVGNLAALNQTNVKRLLAYSSVAHIGYILAGLAVGTGLGFSSGMFYVLAYAFMNIGAFAVLIALANQGEGETVRDLAGLARREPVLAFLMFLFILSLIGIPPLAGFWAKLFVIRAAVDSGLLWLAVAVAINSAISVGYYYGMVRSMYVAPAPEGRGGVNAGIFLQLGLALAAAGVLVLGFWPDTFLYWVTATALTR